MATLRVTLSYTFYSQLFQNVLHFHKPDYTEIPDLANLATDVKTSWINEVKWVQTDGTKYINMKIHEVGSTISPYNETLSIVGGASGSTEYKPFNCHIIRIRTAVGGRIGRGRVYIGGIATNLTDNGIVKSSIITTWNTHLANIMSAFGPSGSSDWRLGVNPHTESDDFKDVLSLSINPVEGVQRRRNIGVGI